MNRRLLLGVLLFVALFSAGTIASRGVNVAPQKQWAIVNFVNPVRVADQILMGPHLFVHDDAKMAAGEACTSVYRFDPKGGPKEKVLEFHCRPVQRDVCAKSTFTIVPQTVDMPRVTEYQFAGDSEGHGIPTKE